MSSIRPIQTFGLVAACGILLAVVVVLLLLPALLARRDRGTWVVQHGGAMRWFDDVTAFAARLAIRRAEWVVAGAVLLLAALVPQIRHVEVETDLYRFVDEQHFITRPTQRVEQKLSGVRPIEVVFDGPGFDSLRAPERLQAMRRVQ